MMQTDIYDRDQAQSAVRPSSGFNLIKHLTYMVKLFVAISLLFITVSAILIVPMTLSVISVYLYAALTGMAFTWTHVWMCMLVLVAGVLWVIK